MFSSKGSALFLGQNLISVEILLAVWQGTGLNGIRSKGLWQPEVELLKKFLSGGLCPEEQVQRCVGRGVGDCGRKHPAVLPPPQALIIWVSSSGDSSKGVAGGGYSSNGLNRSRGKSSTAQDPQTWSQTLIWLLGVGRREETRSQHPNLHLDWFCYWRTTLSWINCGGP